MPKSTLRRGLVLLGLTVLFAAPSAHEDDPKVRDRKPAVVGPGYSASAFGAGGGFAFGTAASFAAHDVKLLAWMPLADFGSPQSGNDCWGYTSPSGREYALFAHFQGTHVVEITQPDAPVIVGYVNGPDSLWRDVKVYQNFAYIVSEGGTGIQVVDLSAVDAGFVTHTISVSTGGATSSHNVALDETSGYLYRCGGAGNGLRWYSLANPGNPVYEGDWPDRYVHDAQVKTFTSGPYAGRQIAFACSGFNGGYTQTGVSIVDVTDKSSPVHRGQVTWPGAKYSHQCWLSEDGLSLYVNDENDEDGSFPTTTYVIDVSDIDAPVYKGSFSNANTAVGHNLYVKGDLIYESNYTSGLRVFDTSNPLATVETAWFDTAPGGDAATFNGTWSNYPYFQSGVVIVSDLERGLFVLWVGAPPVQLDIAGGAPTVLDPGGVVLDVTLTELNPGDYAPGTARLFYDAGAGAVAVDLVDLGGGSFSAALPSLPCGTGVDYYLTAESQNGLTWVQPPNGQPFHAIVATAQFAGFDDAFETDQGWSVGAPGDDATTGIWTRTNPIGTVAQPEDDHTLAGGFCYFTGQGPIGGAAGDNDVDGGKTTLLSPVLDLSGPADPWISYWRWYSNATGPAPEADVFLVDISNDGGGSWTNVEIVGPAGDGVHGGWIRHEFRVADHVPPTASVRLRFVASDESPGSIVEAALDDFAVFGLECPLSADGAVLDPLAGGTVTFALDGSAVHAGKLYLLLGSLAGTAPGFDLGLVHVPLVQDAYFDYSLVHANGPLLVNSFAALDGAGKGSAHFVLPSGFPSLIGLTAHHAWLAIDPATLQVAFASNALPLSFQ
jgi:choice-of-anchor B domain-containing protein